MKRFALFLILIVVVCSYRKSAKPKFTKNVIESIHSLKLPFLLRCDNFPDKETHDTALYYGKIVTDKIVIILSNRIENRSPVLYTVNKKGVILDSLIVFDGPCNYVNETASYEPWLEITNDLNVNITDTTYTVGGRSDSTHMINGSPSYYMVYNPKISSKKFKIAETGYIIATKPD